MGQDVFNYRIRRPTLLKCSQHAGFAYFVKKRCSNPSKTRKYIIASVTMKAYLFNQQDHRCRACLTSLVWIVGGKKNRFVVCWSKPSARPQGLKISRLRAVGELADVNGKANPNRRGCASFPFCVSGSLDNFTSTRPTFQYKGKYNFINQSSSIQQWQSNVPMLLGFGGASAHITEWSSKATTLSGLEV